MANLSNINGKFVVDTAGNIGVGTLTPRSDANTTNISIQSSGTARLFVNNTGASGKEYAIYSSANGDFGIFDYGAVSARLVINSAGNSTFAGNITAPGLVYNATNKYLSISHWSSPPTPAAILHLSDNANDIDVPQIRIEGRENPGDTRLDISVKDPDVRFNLVEGSTDASSGYGLMIFKTNAAPQASFPTRGGFNFQTPASSSSLFITNEANVGIGTASPSATEPIGGNLPTGWTRANSRALEIAAPDFANSGLFLRNSDTTATGTDITGDHYYGDTYIDNRFNNDNGSIYFRTKTAVSPQIRMAIKGSGNVGIGTQGPPSKLTVMESTLCTNSGTDGGTSYVPTKPILLVTTDGNGTPSGYYATNSVFTVGIGGGITGNVTTEHLRVNLNGKVGIGTDSPTTTLSVKGTSSNGINVIGVGTTATRCYLGLNSANKGYLFIAGSSGENPAVITSQGNSYISTNLGIGTTSPTQKLEVAGNIRIDSRSKAGSGEVDNITFTKDRPDASTGTYEMGAIRSFTTNGYSGGMTFYSGRHTGGGGYALIAALTIGDPANIGPAVVIKNGDSTSARIYPETDNAGYLGESSHRWQAVYAVNGSIQTSDRNQKTSITKSDLGLDFILKLEPVSYKWKVGGWDIKENGEDKEPTKTPIEGKRNHYGLIAQQVKEVIGDKDFGGWVKEDLEDEASIESLRYAEFISPMIKAIQELKADNDSLKARIETLENN